MSIPIFSNILKCFADFSTKKSIRYHDDRVKMKQHSPTTRLRTRTFYYFECNHSLLRAQWIMHSYTQRMQIDVGDMNI